VIEFRPLAAADLPLLHSWLQREHVKRWWRPDDTPAGTAGRYLPAIEGRDPSDHYLIVLEGRPVGMLETYLVADHPDWQAIVGAEDGVAGVDLLIGEEESIGQGLGPRVIAEFTREVVFARGATACVAAVEESNRRSWRAFEKAGFRHVRDVEEDGVPHRLMRLDRPWPDA
jgi:aminoglycoside 6'-N-acetyltransferase